MNRVGAGLPLIKLRLYLQEGKGVDIDVFLAESPYQQVLMQRRQVQEADEHKVWFVSPEDLVLLKLVAARQRDLADVSDVLFVQGQLDQKYMHHWARELGVAERLDQALCESQGP